MRLSGSFGLYLLICFTGQNVQHQIIGNKALAHLHGKPYANIETDLELLILLSVKVYMQMPFHATLVGIRRILTRNYIFVTMDL